MENKQDGRKTKARPKGSSPNENQLDLWGLGGGARPAPAEENGSSIVPEPVEFTPVSEGSPSPANSMDGQTPTGLPAFSTTDESMEGSGGLGIRSEEPAEYRIETPTPRSAGNLRARSTPAAGSLATAAARALPALTRRQHDLLVYLRDRETRGERPPSLGEICRDLGLASRGSLHKQVVALVEAGLVEAMNGKQRGVRLIEAANDEDGAIPLLGAIAAGRPIEALIRDERITLPAWLKVPGPCYALRVKGDSMRDAGILDGDVVVVEQRQHARNGETVVALIDGESATLKRIEQKPGEIVLHPENPAFQPQHYRPEQVAIQGVLVAALRRY
jgi:repressor LexA